MIRRIHWSEVESRVHNKLHLDRNEPQEWTPIHQEIRNAITPASFNYYPDLQKAYDNLAFIAAIVPEKLLLTAGADDAIKQILDYYSKLSLRVLDPTYKMPEIYVENRGSLVNRTPYEIKGNKFSYDKDQLTRNYPEIVYLANPDNPTGHFHDDKFIIEMIETPGVKVIIDETYMPYSNQDSHREYHMYLGHPDLYVVRSFSKILGAGFKLGYIIGWEENIRYLSKTKLAYEISGFNANVLKIIAENRTLFYELPIWVNKNKQEIYYILDQIGLSYIKTDTNFVLIDSTPVIKEELDKYCYYKVVKIKNREFIKITVPNNDVMDQVREEFKDFKGNKDEKYY